METTKKSLKRSRKTVTLPQNSDMAKTAALFKQNSDIMRQSIIEIDESYNHDWDILAELVQNSIDAIRKAERKTDGKLVISIDCQNHTIKIEDNGNGIDHNDIETLLSLFGTNKKQDEKTIGEKGVGLKFAIFSCNDFYLKTATKNNASYAKVQNAYSWKTGTDTTIPNIEYDGITKDFDGTSIELKSIPESPLFDLNFIQLKYILRTKTAAGNTNWIWNIDDIDISIELNYVSPNGASEKEKIPFKYWMPYEGLGNKDKISLTEFREYATPEKTDQQKRIMLHNKIVYHTKSINIKNRDIYAVICLVPNRATWNTLSKSANLGTEEELESDDFLQSFGYATFRPGIYTSVKGMPTGISIEHPITGAAGEWARIFMLFEDRKLKFDIGRKSIHGKTAKLYQDNARGLFNEFRQTVSPFTSGDTPDNHNWDKDIIFKEIDTLIDLNSTKTKFIKTPKDQEATIAGMFFEGIGNGNIKEITPLQSGYKERYDLYALSGAKRVVIEFKSQLYKIIRDFNDETKLFNEVDCIVCWNVSEEDTQQFKYVGITLEEVPTPSVLNPTVDVFPNSSYLLRLSGYTKPIYVIDMKKIIS